MPRFLHGSFRTMYIYHQCATSQLASPPISTFHYQALLLVKVCPLDPLQVAAQVHEEDLVDEAAVVVRLVRAHVLTVQALRVSSYIALSSIPSIINCFSQFKASVSTVGVKRSGTGTAGRKIAVRVNAFETTVQEGYIYHYDGERRLYKCFRLVCSSYICSWYVALRNF